MTKDKKDTKGDPVESSLFDSIKNFWIEWTEPLPIADYPLVEPTIFMGDLKDERQKLINLFAQNPVLGGMIVTENPRQAALRELIHRVNNEPESGFSPRNREKQHKNLLRAEHRRERPNPQSPAMAVLHAFEDTYPGIRPGRIVQIKQGAQYSVTRPGTKILIWKISLNFDLLYSSSKEAAVVGYGLNDEGRMAFDLRYFNFKVKDLELIPRDQEIKILDSWLKPDPAYAPLKDGDPVVLVREVLKMEDTMFGTISRKFPKGLSGVVDVPDLQHGGSANDINDPKDGRPTVNVDLYIDIPSYGVMDLYKAQIAVPTEGHGYMYKIYIPSLRTHIECPRSMIDKRPFRKDLWRDLEIPDVARRKILECSQGTLGTQLESWGLTGHLTKGKGAIMLYWGPPGTGKSATAEALAEYLERPIYNVDSSILGNTQADFEEGLKETIDRAKRWKAVVLWDEAEIYLKGRGDNTEQNQRVAAILRHLEAFEGILVLTTNRPVELDFAIQSRIHHKIRFMAFDDTRREKIWRVTIPAKMPIDGLEAVMPQLAAIDINGREVKTAILNAATCAAHQGLDKVPAQFLLEEAQELYRSSKALRDARARGEDWAVGDSEEQKPLEKLEVANGKAGVKATPPAPEARKS